MATRVTVEKGRAPLQKSMVDRFGPPAGDQISVWLFVVDPGHLRILSERELGELIDMDEFNKADVLALETKEERERLTALRMRLIPTSIVPERRLKIPLEAFDTCGEYLDRTHVWLEHCSSYVDIYTATHVQRVLSIPPSRFLPTTFETK